MDINWVVERVVMQPTTFCNINCNYCYLSGRDKAKRMPLGVASRVADWFSVHDRPIEIIWHGGEPLATGAKHFVDLLEAMEDARMVGAVSHVIQTNGTLITPEWCELFHRFKVKVGLSVDGPVYANRNRLDWQGNETFERVLKGAKLLSKSQVPFAALCVVTKDTLDKPEELYRFFCELGCKNAGFNIEEKLGPHESSASDDERLVKSFWRRLFDIWKQDQAIQIREFLGALTWMRDVCEDENTSNSYDLFPTIGWNGDVAVLAPELLGVESERYGNFIIGNILEESLGAILERATHTRYVEEYAEGVRACSKTCQYFGFCRGGVGSNKYFELGWTGGTETVYCRNREQRLLDAVMEAL